jgi:RNA polymerase sigma-70 factor (ECF subfamily)
MRTLTEMTFDSAQLLARAQAGDGHAFGELTEPFRRELHVHCYRILGSVHDAEDVTQETMLAAWRGIERFEGRASLRFWLYRIATNQCLNALRGSGRRTARSGPQPDVTLEQMAALPPSATDSEPPRLEPYPDVLLADLADTSPGPEARYEARESISLAFVAALQHLSPRQRATLVLRDVLGYRAAETAGLLGCTLDSVNSSLRRARAALADHVPPGGFHQAPLPGSATERGLLARVTDAFEHGDIGALVALLTDDVWLTMPPSPFGFQGRAAAERVLSVLTFRGGTRRFRLVATRANGQPAFGCYITDNSEPATRAYGMMVLALAGDRIAGATRFHDNSLLPWFGLPEALPVHPRG